MTSEGQSLYFMVWPLAGQPCFTGRTYTHSYINCINWTQWILKTNKKDILFCFIFLLFNSIAAMYVLLFFPNEFVIKFCPILNASYKTCTFRTRLFKSMRWSSCLGSPTFPIFPRQEVKQTPFLLSLWISLDDFFFVRNINLTLSVFLHLPTVSFYQPFLSCWEIMFVKLAMAQS